MVDTGALLEEAYRFCGRAPDAEELLPWAEKVLRLGEEIDQRGGPESLRAALGELCTLVEAHPEDFTALADWAEEKLETWGLEGFPTESAGSFGEQSPREGAFLFLDALASAPERAALDREASAPPDAERILASLPPESLQRADRAIREARDWKAKVHELFARAEQHGQKGAPISFAALADSPLEEDYILLHRRAEGELLLTRSEASVFADWYGEGEPELTVDGRNLAHRPLPQGQGRRWSLPGQARPFTLRLEFGDLAYSIEIPAPDES